MNIEKVASKIERHYESHNVHIKITKYEVVGNGERCIYTVKLRPGTKESQIFDRAPDIRLAMKMPLFQPFREYLTLCIAVSERPLTENSLRKMLGSMEFHRSNLLIPVPLGYDMRGKMWFVDLVKFPHGLYGGQTGSGKTVGLQNLISSIAFLQPVNRVNLIIIDTGASGLDVFHSLPHLSCNIIKDEKDVVTLMQYLFDEMEQRISLPESELRLLPAIVVVQDEYISLIQNMKGEAKNELISTLQNLLRRGRHAKIHMILATQEAAKRDMLISMNNLNARMAYTCSNIYNSISILGESGAEKLPGKGAMYFKSPEQPKPVCLQCAYMSTDEIEQLVAHINTKHRVTGNKFIVPELGTLQAPAWTPEDSEDEAPAEVPDKKQLVGIIMWALERESISASQIIDRFRMGNKAYRVMDELFRLGLIAEKIPNHNQPRAVIPQSIEDIPEEAMELLLKYGVSVDDITAVIAKRTKE